MSVTPVHCAVCATPLPPGGVIGHCPKCLIEITLTVPIDSAGDGTAAWSSLGGCELFEEIGRGGMGVVYRARQVVLNRTVAVKVLLRAAFVSEIERLRFQREAEAAARLQHPGIVAIHDIGEADGVPWFSMEYVAGRNLDELAREHPMPASEAAVCLLEIARAVRHAHEHRVLHRDLKPSNIIIDHEGRPHITDFGIARQRDGDTNSGATALTRTGQTLGSPGYAAPEQVFGGSSDARTDVYGLGAILYHLLTARPPFQGPTLDAILIQLREAEPLPPQRLNPTVPRDLETICLKCLRKSPDARYATAAEVAEDLARFLDGRTIIARPIGLTGQAWRWCRRRPGAAVLLASLALLSVAMVLGSLRFAKREADQEHANVLLARARSWRTEHAAGSRTLALKALADAWTIRPTPELRNETIACLALPELTTGRVLSAGDPAARMPDLTASMDGIRLAQMDGDTVVVKDRSSGSIIARLADQLPGSLLKLDETGDRIAIVAPHGTELEVRSVHDGSLLFTCTHPEPIHSIDWSGELIASGCEDRFIYIWDDVGRLCHRLSGHEDRHVVVRFRPHGQELCSTAADAVIHLWHAARGEEILHQELSTEKVGQLWWAADGSAFFTRADGATETQEFRLDWPRGFHLLAPSQDEPHSENLITFDLSPDGTLAATSDARVNRVWDFRQSKLAAIFPKGRKEWVVTKFSPDGKTLWLSGWDNGCISRSVTRNDRGKVTFGQPSEPLFGAGNLIQDISSDGSMLVLSNNNDGYFTVCWPATGQQMKLAQADVLSAAFSPDARWLVTTSYTQLGANIWSLPDGKLVRTITTPAMVTAPRFSHDQKTLLLRMGNSAVRYHTADWTPDPTFPTDLNLHGAIWSADGKTLACHDNQSLRLLRADTFAEIARLTIPAYAGWLGEVQCAFSADGTKLVMHTALGTVLRWDLTELRQELRERGMDW